MKKVAYILIFTISIIILWKSVIRTPAYVMHDFIHGNRPEPMLTRPLERAGDKILPIVLEAIKDKDFPRRRYAIGFIGDKRYALALPTLLKILEDKNEHFYFRDDALIAIYKIAPERAKEEARHYTHIKHPKGLHGLGHTAKAIVNGEKIRGL